MKILWRKKYSEEPPAINSRCEACGVEFFRPTFMCSESKHVFCSRRCGGDYRNGKRSGKVVENLCGHGERKHFSRNMCYPCYRRWSRYGVTSETFTRLGSKFNGKCHICRQQKGLHIDHCHQTGVVRGLLCRHCNLGIGYFFDSPKLMKMAMRYVQEHSAEKEV